MYNVSTMYIEFVYRVIESLPDLNTGWSPWNELSEFSLSNPLSCELE